jgi:hypothetical protein
MPAFQIDNDSSEALPLVPRPVIHADCSNLIGRHCSGNRIFNPAQQGMTTHRHTQSIQQPLAGTTSQRPAHHGLGFSQPIGLPRIIRDNGGQSLGENLAATFWSAAPPSPDIQVQRYTCSLQRKICDLTPIPTVPGTRHYSTTGTDRAVLAIGLHDPPVYRRHNTMNFDALQAGK